jgi:hypothetical protein
LSHKNLASDYGVVVDTSQKADVITSSPKSCI